jgi:hypothetical protein
VVAQARRGGAWVICRFDPLPAETCIARRSRHDRDVFFLPPPQLRAKKNSRFVKEA